MDTKRFTRASNGRVVRTLDGAPAFAPGPLPPPVAVNWPTAKLIAEAERATGNLAGIGRLLPDPHILIQPLARREAVLSSRIEGTEASFSDLAVFEAAGRPDSDASDVREVSNYVRALEYGLKRLDKLPISQRFLREVHEILMTGVRGSTKMPGDFRAVQNWIGTPGATLASATYVPPPVAEMHAALDAFERYIHAPSELPTLVRVALIHYQFEAIHPFLDGNGRVGRLLIAFLLNVEHVLEQPLLYLSAYFERHRSDYYRLLLDVSMRGAWAEWIDFFLRGVIEQANDAVHRTRRLLDLTHDYRARLAGSRNLARMSSVVDDLLMNPATTVSAVAAKLRISYPAAKKNVDKLVAERVLMPIRQAKGNVYIAQEIIDIIDAP
jgi:Fic family protein